MVDYIGTGCKVGKVPEQVAVEAVHIPKILYIFAHSRSFALLFNALFEAILIMNSRCFRVDDSKSASKKRKFSHR